MAADGQTGQFPRLRLRRDIAEKIALPVILVISILAARLVVGLRSAVTLSGLIELSRSGLSVRMPLGNGWQCESKWIYQDNGFIIRSTLTVNPANQSQARCRYLLATEAVTPEQRFDEQAAGLEGKVVETGQLKVNHLAVEWARIIRYIGEESDLSGLGIAAYETIFGICELPAGRQLEIEVLSQEEGLCWNAFERIAKGVRFNDNGLLQAGAEVIGEVKSGGLADISPDVLSPERNLTSAFIILNSRGRAIGFMTNAIVAENEAQPTVKAAYYYYFRRPLPDEQVGFFRGDAAFEQFTWKVEASSHEGTKGIEMEGKNGVLTTSFAADRRSGSEENEYVLGQAAVPDVVLELVEKKLLDSSREEIIVDVIRSDGTVAPVYIEKISPTVARQAYAYALRFEILDGRGYWQQIYYDQAKQPAKILLGQDTIFTFQHATANQIAEAFPERADIVRNQRQFLEREGI
jgi:hypothetical protein